MWSPKNAGSLECDVVRVRTAHGCQCLSVYGLNGIIGTVCRKLLVGIELRSLRFVLMETCRRSACVGGLHNDDTLRLSRGREEKRNAAHFVTLSLATHLSFFNALDSCGSLAGSIAI